MKNFEKKISNLNPDLWDSSLNHILKQMKGKPLNIHKLMANHPTLLGAWWNFRNHSVSGGSLGNRKGELVILRVSVHLKSWYEWASHVDRALHCGLTLEEIRNVNSPLSESNWKTDEFLLLLAVDELISLRSISVKTYNKLKKYFNDQQIMDIVAIHGMYIILGCLINIYDLNLDTDIASRLPETIVKNDLIV